jgi:methyl acetate hydrolase
MSDTSFKLSATQRERLVTMHAREAEGALQPVLFETEQNPAFESGGAGLYGTAQDYLRFTQMILNKGVGNGKQILKADTVALMSQNHIGEIHVGKLPTAMAFLTNDVELHPDMVKKWSLGWMLNGSVSAEGRSINSLFWAGLGNTYNWIDPVRNVTGVIMMQVLPFADQKCLATFSAFEREIYASVAPSAV